MERAHSATGRDAESAPGRTPGEPAALVSAPLGPTAVLALQHTAGNAAVTALLAREPVPAPPAEKKAAPAQKTPIELLRELLAKGDEDAAIAQMAALSRDDAAIALGRQDLRDLAVKAFNDKEMARGISGMKGGSLLLELAETLDGEPLAPGETRRVSARAPEGTGALLAFAPLTIELPANGDLVALDGFLVAGPA